MLTDAPRFSAIPTTISLTRDLTGASQQVSKVTCEGKRPLIGVDVALLGTISWIAWISTANLWKDIVKPQS